MPLNIQKHKNKLIGVKCDFPNCGKRIKEGEQRVSIVPKGKNKKILYCCLEHKEEVQKNMKANQLLDIWEELNITRRCILHCFFHYIIFVNQHKNNKFSSEQDKTDMIMSCIERDLRGQKTLLIREGSGEIDRFNNKIDKAKICKDIIQPALKNIENEIEKGYVPPERINVYKQMLDIKQDKEAMNKVAQNVADILQEVQKNENVIKKLLKICSTLNDTDSIKSILQNYDTAFQLGQIINQLKIIKSLKSKYDKENKKLEK